MKSRGLITSIFGIVMMFVALVNCSAQGGRQSTGTTAPAVDQNTTQTVSSVPGTRLLKVTLDDTDVVTAELIDSPAAKAFTTMLPMTLNMTDYLKREKHAPSPGTIGRESLTNIQVEYAIGDIIYYPPGPTIAAYYDHDGRTIAAGMEVVARLDVKGVAAFKARPAAVKVTFELADETVQQTGRRVSITLNGTKTITADLVDTPVAGEFLAHLPVTFTMKEHLNRQKEVYLPFKLSENNLQNPVYEYAVGDIVYWHPGPTMGIFHSHDGRRINAGVEILARLDAAGVAVIASFPGDVEVTFAPDN